MLLHNALTLTKLFFISLCSTKVLTRRDRP
jgi:hypothetical protein